jgi:hypothetical protein
MVQKEGFQLDDNASENLAASAFVKNAGANDAIPIATAATIANIFVIRISFLQLSSQWPNYIRAVTTSWNNVGQCGTTMIIILLCYYNPNSSLIGQKY